MAHAMPRKDSRVPVAQRAPLQSGARLLAAQFVALLQKNIRIRAASWKTNVLLLAQAALFTLLIWGVDRALLASRQRQGAYSTSPDLHARAIGDIPDCTTSIYLRRDRPCLTLAYAPQVPAVACTDACEGPGPLPCCCFRAGREGLRGQAHCRPFHPPHAGRRRRGRGGRGLGGQQPPTDRAGAAQGASL